LQAKLYVATAYEKEAADTFAANTVYYVKETGKYNRQPVTAGDKVPKYYVAPYTEVVLTDLTFKQISAAANVIAASGFVNVAAKDITAERFTSGTGKAFFGFDAVASDSVIAVKNGEFSYGDSFMTFAGKLLTIEDSEISRMKSAGSAVSITNDSAIATITGTRFRFNESTADGAAISATLNTGSLTIEDTMFQHNTSAGNGGAISIIANKGATYSLDESWIGASEASGTLGNSTTITTDPATGDVTEVIKGADGNPTKTITHSTDSRTGITTSTVYAADGTSVVYTMTQETSEDQTTKTETKVEGMTTTTIRTVTDSTYVTRDVDFTDSGATDVKYVTKTDVVTTVTSETGKPDTTVVSEPAAYLYLNDSTVAMASITTGVATSNNVVTYTSTITYGGSTYTCIVQYNLSKAATSELAGHQMKITFKNGDTTISSKTLNDIQELYSVTPSFDVDHVAGGTDKVGLMASVVVKMNTNTENAPEDGAARVYINLNN